MGSSARPSIGRQAQVCAAAYFPFFLFFNCMDHVHKGPFPLARRCWFFFFFNLIFLGESLFSILYPQVPCLYLC